MIVNKNKANNNKLLALFYFFAVAISNLPGQTYFVFPSVTGPVRVLQLGVLLISIISILIHNETPNRTWLLVVVYYVFTYGRAFLSASSAEIQLSTPINAIALCTLTFTGLRRNKSALCTGYTCYFFAVALFQLFLMITRHDLFVLDGEFGLFENRNYLVRFFLPGMLFAMIASYEKRGKIWNLTVILYLALMTTIIIMAKSGTGMIGILVFLILSIIFSKKQLPRWLSVNLVAIYSAIIFLLIYFFNFQENFDFLIVDILNKDITFTGRTYIWDSAISVIKQYPFLGIGESSNLRAYLYGASHAHQYWLQLLLTGGIVSCSIVFAMYHLAGKNTKKHPESCLFKLVSITIISFLIMGIDESLMGATMLMPLLVVASETSEAVYSTSQKTALRTSKMSIK